jgi:hypothetical protein
MESILELFRQCGILELFPQCGILELFQQCGILELFPQCGILELFPQCGTHKYMTSNTQIHDHLLSWLDTGTSIKSGGVKLVLPPLLVK